MATSETGVAAYVLRRLLNAGEGRGQSGMNNEVKPWPEAHAASLPHILVD